MTRNCKELHGIPSNSYRMELQEFPEGIGWMDKEWWCIRMQFSNDSELQGIAGNCREFLLIPSECKCRNSLKEFDVWGWGWRWKGMQSSKDPELQWIATSSKSCGGIGMKEFRNRCTWCRWRNWFPNVQHRGIGCILQCQWCRKNGASRWSLKGVILLSHHPVQI